MSYQDTLDKKESVKAAKREMEHFQDLLKLYTYDIYNVRSPSLNNLVNTISFLQADKKQLEEICKRDKRLEYILRVYNAICLLDEEELLFVYNKFVLDKSYEEISELFNCSIRNVQRTLNKSLFKLSIILKIEVIKN